MTVGIATARLCLVWRCCFIARFKDIMLMNVIFMYYKFYCFNIYFMLFPIPCNVLHNVIHFNWILSFRCVSFDGWQVSFSMYTITYALNQPSSRLSRNNLYSFVLLSAKTNRILLLFSNFICFQYFTFIACLGKYFIHPL